MKKTSTKVTTPSSQPATVPPAHDDIARRAYELWIMDGCPAGRAVYHWHEAERQLQKERQNPQAASKYSTENERSLAAMMDDGSPYNALEKEAPLSAKVERDLAKTNVKASPSSGASVNVD